jgi:plastocyanin
MYQRGLVEMREAAEMLDRTKPTGWARRGVAIGAVTVLILGLLAPGLAVAADPGVTITESGDAYHFTPQSITVTVGQTVRWSNSTDAPHTVTSTGSGPLGSPIINQGGSFQVSFSSAGTFAYHCSIHTYMRGTIRVVAANQPPPNRPPGATPLPQTDAITTGMSRHGWLLGLIGIATFAMMLLFGGRFRRRAG